MSGLSPCILHQFTNALVHPLSFIVIPIICQYFVKLHGKPSKVPGSLASMDPLSAQAPESLSMPGQETFVMVFPFLCIAFGS
jgi:hypothetical protein